MDELIFSNPLHIDTEDGQQEGGREILETEATLPCLPLDSRKDDVDAYPLLRQSIPVPLSQVVNQYIRHLANGEEEKGSHYVNAALDQLEGSLLNQSLNSNEKGTVYRHAHGDSISSTHSAGGSKKRPASSSNNNTTNDHQKVSKRTKEMLSLPIPTPTPSASNRKRSDKLQAPPTPSARTDGFDSESLMDDDKSSRRTLTISTANEEIASDVSMGSARLAALPSPSISTASSPRIFDLNEDDFGRLSEGLNDENYVEIYQTDALDIPRLVAIYDRLPSNLQTYILYHLIQKSHKNSLRFVNSIITPVMKRDFLSSLPLELSFNILRFLDAKSICVASQVCRRWNGVVDACSPIWKVKFEEDGFKLEDYEVDRVVNSGFLDEPQIINARRYRSVPSTPTTPVRQIRREWQNDGKTVFDNATNLAQTSEDLHMTTEESEAMLSNIYVDAEMLKINSPPVNTGIRLYKDFYKRHYRISKSWLSLQAKPRHIAFPGHGASVVTCLQFDSDKLITGSDDYTLCIWETQTGKLRKRLTGHEGGVWALAYVDNILVSGSTDRSVRVWDIERGVCTHVFSGHSSTVRCLQILMPKPDASNNNVMVPAFPTIITGSRDNNLKVWRLPLPGTDDFMNRAPRSNSNYCPYFLRTLQGHTNSVRSIAGDGDTLVSGSYDTTVRVWRVSTGECVWRLTGHQQRVYSVVLDSKRKRCVSGSMDQLVRIWCLDLGICLWTLDGHSSLVGLLDLKDDYLISAAADSTLRIWNPDTGACKSILSAHTGAITCFQHDKHKLISGSDGSLKIWNTKTGQYNRDLMTSLSSVWQVRFDERRCVAAVQREGAQQQVQTFLEVIDFGAEIDGWPDNEKGRRRVINPINDDLVN